MKLETKLGIYAIVILLLVLIGLTVMLYEFEYYSNIEIPSFPGLLIVFGTKAIGVLMLYIASEIYSKHFKLRNNES